MDLVLPQGWSGAHVTGVDPACGLVERVDTTLPLFARE